LIFIAKKKNGKAALASGLSDYLLIADDEPGAEVYSAAATMEEEIVCVRNSGTPERKRAGNATCGTREQRNGGGESW
jgi:hypothetical protein